jgi:hypothetical protein
MMRVSQRAMWPALFLSLLIAASVSADEPAERTSFQTGRAFDPRIQLGSDVAMVYGIDPGLPDRIATWRAQGYRIHVMTGVSWGQYQDYLYGRFDGVNHEDEAQTDRRGNKISHGGDVYYMAPGENYGKFLCVGVQRALDAGAEAIHLEEPEFWVRGGYSEGFKRAWKAEYGEDWAPPHESVDASWRSAQLKYRLYGRALKQVFEYVKDYNSRTGRNVKCYVPTHSLINYAKWGIVSPESSLLDVGADGYIAQVWTGTARSSNLYQGQERERTFETAFLEYGQMASLTSSTGARVWFLNDPIEDDPNHSWTDYRTNFHSTLVASLLWPAVAHYEVMPWPERVMTGKYPATEGPRRRRSDRDASRVEIPPAYATELMTLITSQNDMNWPDTTWEHAGAPTGIGVLVSDSLMLERGDPTPSDPHLGSFFGLAMPLVKHGLPAQPVQLETIGRPGALDPYRVLVLTYEGQKPLTPAPHETLAEWVRKGGSLVVVDADRDPYNAVRAWWNDPSREPGAKVYATPREHLFERLGIPSELPGGSEAEAGMVHRVGLGAVVVASQSPAALSRQKDGGEAVRSLVRRACEATGVEYRESNALVMRRGPYVIGAAMDESIDSAPPVIVTGRFINLLDAGLPVISQIELKPGDRALVRDLDHPASRPGNEPKILASAFRPRDVQFDTAAGVFRFRAVGPDRVEAVARIAWPDVRADPASGSVDGATLDDFTWDAASRTVLLRFASEARGRALEIRESAPHASPKS